MDETRFEELRRYVGFSAEDEGLLIKARSSMEPVFDSIVDRFYKRLRDHRDAFSVFKDDAQIERQKISLRGWLERLFSGPYDEAYHDVASRIGHVHVSVGLPQRYMLTGMNLVRCDLHLRVMEVAGGAPSEALHTAIDRALDVDLAVMLESYFASLLNRAQEAERLEALRRADRLAAIGTLAAGLAHEIRNPLNGAQLHLTLVERGLADRRVPASDLIDAIQVTKGEVLRLSNLVTEFLDFARPQPLTFRICDVRELADRAVAAMAADAAERRISLTAAGPSALVSADPDKLFQVILNLVRNAIEASSVGDPAVVVRTVRSSTLVTLEVEDNGVGIADPSAPIFDPFFTTKAGGTGLGLSIAHRIVTDHQGTLHGSTQRGKTVFSIRLPPASDS